jgi:hypothetical protein
LKHSEPLKDEVHNEVIENLKDGKVLPIFHTLCQNPDNRLFPPNTRVSDRDPDSDIIELSAASVTKGEFWKDKETVGKISIHEERSYLTAFFEMDKGFIKVEDQGCQWEFDEDYTEIVTNLVNTPAEMVGEDIEVTKLLQPLAVDDSSGRNLVTRRLSRGVVADCLAKSKRRSNYVIVGNPGIGKSWNLIYTLQQALLYENACVILCFQQDGIAMTCIRKNNMIYVWTCKHKSFATNLDSLLFQNSKVLVLLDPLESTKGGATFSEGRRMMIIAASNNKNHFKSIGKRTGHFARFLSCFSNAEMRISLPYMTEDDGQSLQMDEVLERAIEVGNLPRYVLNKALFEERQQHTTTAINSLEKKQVKDILTFNGLNNSDSTVQGCIFVVNVKLQAENDDDTQDDTTEHDEHQYSDMKLQIDEKVGYDGQLIPDYGKTVVSIISNHVLTRIVSLSREYVLSFWGITSAGKRSEMGHIVENLFWQDLQKPYLMKTFFDDN